MSARLAAAAVAASLMSAATLAWQSEPPSPADRFTVTDAMIPARDGVRLHTKIFTPKDQREALPIIMRRTPYGVEGSAGVFTTYMKALAEEG